jgi:hypothetical protein
MDRTRFAAEEASRDAYLKQRAEAARAAKTEAEPPRLPLDRNRFAAEETSRDAYLKQRADAARAAKTEAELPRLPVDRDRFAAEEASRDAYLKQRAEATKAAGQPNPPATPPVTPTPLPSARPVAGGGNLWRMALTGLGWAIAMAITLPSFLNLSAGSNVALLILASAFAGAIGGLFTGSALRANGMPARLLQITLVAVIWTICQALFMAAIVATSSNPTPGILAIILLWLISGGLTALVAVLTLGPQRPPLARSLQVIVLSAIAWGLSIVAGGVAVVPVVGMLGDLNPVSALITGAVLGAVAGAIGGGVMAWQIGSALNKNA